MFRRVHTSVMSSMQKLVPWSVCNLSRAPNRKTHFSTNAFATSAAVIDERDSDYVFRKIISYDQDVFVSRVSLTRYWSQDVGSNFHEPYSHCDWLQLGFQISASYRSRCTWFATFDPFINVFSSRATRTVVEFYRVSCVMQSALLLPWSRSVVLVRCFLQLVGRMSIQSFIMNCSQLFHNPRTSGPSF